MSDQPRNTLLKLKIPKSSSPPTAPAGPGTPATTATPKLKLKFNNTSTPRTEVPTNLDSPAAASPKVTIKFKQPKKPKSDAPPSSKKRDLDSVEGAPQTPGSIGKKLKLSIGKKSASGDQTPKSATITTPFVRFKVNGYKQKFKKPKSRLKGYAYDSEASDREEEPIQQWNFILRMPPGEDADFVRKIIESNTLGQHKQSLKLRFLQEDGRRAMLTVRQNTYAAILVDLPCVIESMKGWDKKAWYKSADIHQMLLVLGTITHEEEALKYPLPSDEVDGRTWAYAHGITPPMNWARKRRFRKRISTHAIQDIEKSVQRLLEKDQASIGDVRYDVLDREAMRQLDEPEFDYDEYEDGEGEYEYEYGETPAAEELMDEEEDLEAQFESLLEGGGEDHGVNVGMGDMAATPGSSSTAAFEPHNPTDSDMETPAALPIQATSEEEEDEDEDDDDDDDDDDDSDKEQRAGFQRAREEITELEAAIKEQMAEMERVGNPLLQNRIRNKIQALQADLEMKKAGVGDEDDD